MPSPHPFHLISLLGFLCLSASADWEKREIEGWSVQVRTELLREKPAEAGHALEVIRGHLAGILQMVPAAAVEKLRRVTLWVSPPYPGVAPKAEYHPGAGWLREQGRDPQMEKGVELTNTQNIDRETLRMPLFVLHELAHAYHDQVLGFQDPEVKAAYEQAVASGIYAHAERWHGDGRPNSFGRAYALTNEREYFAETTEAFFSRNDFFPFTRAELAQADPGMLQLLARVWGAPLPGGANATQTLRILCWSEYVPPSVLESFAERTGVKCEVETYNSNDQMLARLREMPRHYDLVQPSQFYAEKLIAAGGLEPLDRARIPYLAHLDPRYLGLPHDPENRFTVPWLVGTVGIVINLERVKEPVETWADVFSGKHAGRIVVVDDPREMVAWALASLGLPITDIGDANLARVRPVLARWLPQVKVFDADSPKTALLNGDADVGIVWSGEAALLWEHDQKFRYTLPAIGAHLFLDSLAIPAGAPEKSLAADFINHCLDRKISVLISNAYPYTNPNAAARALLTPAQLANPASYPPGDRPLAPLRNVGNEGEAVNRLVRELRGR